MIPMNYCCSILATVHLLEIRTFFENNKTDIDATEVKNIICWGMTATGDNFNEIQSLIWKRPDVIYYLIKFVESPLESNLSLDEKNMILELSIKYNCFECFKEIFGTSFLICPAPQIIDQAVSCNRENVLEYLLQLSNNNLQCMALIVSSAIKYRLFSIIDNLVKNYNVLKIEDRWFVVFSSILKEFLSSDWGRRNNLATLLKNFLENIPEVGPNAYIKGNFYRAHSAIIEKIYTDLQNSLNNFSPNSPYEQQGYVINSDVLKLLGELKDSAQSHERPRGGWTPNLHGNEPVENNEFTPNQGGFTLGKRKFME